MRRIAPTETLHGTRDGSITLDARTSDRFGLTEREAVTAALLAETMRRISDEESVSSLYVD